jgi:hypothetical protein
MAEDVVARERRLFNEFMERSNKLNAPLKALTDQVNEAIEDQNEKQRYLMVVDHAAELLKTIPLPPAYDVFFDTGIELIRKGVHFAFD